MLTEEVEKNFYDTLSKIKNRDPKIYEKDVEFFKDIQKPECVKKNSKTKPLTLQDYERKMIIEKGAEWSEEENTTKETDSAMVRHALPEAKLQTKARALYGVCAVWRGECLDTASIVSNNVT
ncbi:KRRI-Interacting protein 1 [Homalodisca vitripennis]|nr:KRRI-Interacting protein 1 [Homalodisca vitripennis]